MAKICETKNYQKPSERIGKWGDIRPQAAGGKSSWKEKRGRGRAKDVGQPRGTHCLRQISTFLVLSYVRGNSWDCWVQPLLSWENRTTQEVWLPELSQDPPPLPDPGTFLDRPPHGRPGVRRLQDTRRATGGILKAINTMQTRGAVIPQVPRTQKMKTRVTFVSEEAFVKHGYCTSSKSRCPNQKFQ